MLNDDDDDLEGDWQDEENGRDGGNEPLDEQEAPCPECGEPVQALTDKCAACGYWLLSDDRNAMWPRMRKPLWLRATAWVVLLAFLFSLLAVGLTIF